ncbi:hypothetical protein VT84_13830 [Gemmata sp. SH-PL17]|nr:hypothetical protein VT84_13830 [Gemmata sp. SH-PL17]
MTFPWRLIALGYGSAALLAALAGRRHQRRFYR